VIVADEETIGLLHEHRVDYAPGQLPSQAGAAERGAGRMVDVERTPARPPARASISGGE
jgi:hypothetical protein